MARPAKAIFFDLGETLVTQNIEDNMVTRNALREIRPILPKRVSPERLFKLYRDGYKINETIRSRHHVEIPIQVWMRQLLERIIEDDPSDQLVTRAIEIIVKARATNGVALEEDTSRDSRQFWWTEDTASRILSQIIISIHSATRLEN